MKIDFEGRTWEFDADLITLQQGVALHLAYGMTISEFIRGLAAMDPRSYHFLYWLMLQQAGEKRPIKDLDCNLIGLMAAYVEGLKAEAAAAEPEPEPEPAVPTLPPPGDQAWPGHGYPMATTPQPGGHPYQLQHGPTGYSPSP